MGVNVPAAVERACTHVCAARKLWASEKKSCNNTTAPAAASVAGAFLSPDALKSSLMAIMELSAKVWETPARTPWANTASAPDTVSQGD
jgi:hypothetical protein